MPRAEWNEWKERVYETKLIVMHDECGGGEVLSDGDTIVSASFDGSEAILVIRHVENEKITNIHCVLHRSSIKSVAYGNCSQDNIIK